MVRRSSSMDRIAFSGLSPGHDGEVDLFQCMRYLLECDQRCMAGGQFLQKDRIGMTWVIDPELHPKILLAGHEHTPGDIDTPTLPGRGKPGLILSNAEDLFS